MDIWTLIILFLSALFWVICGSSLLLFTEKMAAWGTKFNLSLWEMLGYKAGDAPWITANPWPFGEHASKLFLRIGGAIVLLIGIAATSILVFVFVNNHS